MRKHPDRFLGSVMVDLRKPLESCVALAEKFREEGFIGVKLYTQMGVEAGLDEHEPFWSALERMGMIVFADCGFLLPNKLDPSMRLETRLSEPFSFEVPMRRHPKLKFELVHFGGGISYLQAIRLMKSLPNVYTDTSPGDGRWPLMNDMPGMRNMAEGRLMFASNTCVNPYEEDEKFYTEKLASVCGFNEKQIEDYFYNNAASFLGLTGK